MLSGPLCDAEPEPDGLAVGKVVHSPVIGQSIDEGDSTASQCALVLWEQDGATAVQVVDGHAQSSPVVVGGDLKLAAGVDHTVGDQLAGEQLQHLEGQPPAHAPYARGDCCP